MKNRVYMLVITGWDLRTEWGGKNAEGVKEIWIGHSKEKAKELLVQIDQFTERWLDENNYEDFDDGMNNEFLEWVEQYHIDKTEDYEFFSWDIHEKVVW